MQARRTVRMCSQRNPLSPTHYRLPYLFTYIPTDPIYQVVDRYLTVNPAATDLAIVLHKLLRLNAEHLWS